MEKALLDGLFTSWFYVRQESGEESQQGEECGDFPVFEANPLSQVFQEVPLTNGKGTVPVQFQYSNAVEGPEGPTPNPERLSQAAGGKG